MSDPKGYPKLYSDPMGLFTEPSTQPSAKNLSNKHSGNLAQQAAFERHAAVIENSAIQQQFSQEFMHLETWLVFSEAIPICLGIHPRDTADIGITDFSAFNEAKALAKTSKETSLNLINPHDQPALWRIKPIDFVSWMVEQKLNPLRVLKDLCLNSEQDNVKQNSPSDAIQAEQILGAALAILANAPTQCIDMNDKVSVDAIYNIMKSKANVWFENGNLPFDKQTIFKLLTSTINNF